MNLRNPTLSPTQVMTIERHFLQSQSLHPEATGILTNLLYDIALAGKLIASQTTRAGLLDVLGKAGEVNIQGEQVMKLDKLSDTILFNMTSFTGRLAGLASEEHENIIPIPKEFPVGKYVLLWDPLDGSSNVDYNVSIGTIFAIYRRITESGPGTLMDFLQPGRKLVAAGYIVYSSSTLLVYSTGQGVHGFTLDQTVGEFLLSHPDIRIPETPKYYSVNQGYEKRWSEGVRRFADYLQGDGENAPNLSLRYIGSMVADLHRNLLAGGVFFYPKDKKVPNGKLRLLYEAAPMAFLYEQAGGAASNGVMDILDIEPKELHQRTPLFIGNKELVQKANEFIRQYG